MTAPDPTPHSIDAQNSPELVLVVQVSRTGLASTADLAALADTLRETAQELLPGARTRTLLSPGPAPLVIDLPARGLILDGNPIELSPTEFAILSHLVRRPRTVVPRTTLRDLGARPGETAHETARTDVPRGTARSVDVHVSRIRIKLARFGSVITTVRGAGYRFDPDPHVHIVQALDRRIA